MPFQELVVSQIHYHVPEEWIIIRLRCEILAKYLEMSWNAGREFLMGTKYLNFLHLHLAIVASRVGREI